MPAPKGTAPYGVVGVTLGHPTERTCPLHAVGTTGGRPRPVLTWAAVAGVAHLFSPEPRDPAGPPGGQRQGGQPGGGQRDPGIVDLRGGPGGGARPSRPGCGRLPRSSSSPSTSSSASSTCSPCCPSTAATWPSPSTRRSGPDGAKVLYHADVAKLMPFTWAFLHVPRGHRRHRPADRHPPSRWPTPSAEPTRPGAGRPPPEPVRAGATGPSMGGMGRTGMDRLTERRPTRQIQVGRRCRWVAGPRSRSSR